MATKVTLISQNTKNKLFFGGYYLVKTILLHHKNCYYYHRKHNLPLFYPPHFVPLHQKTSDKEKII